MSHVINRVRSFLASETDSMVGAVDEPEPTVELGIDGALDVLSNERRRLAIRFVSDHDTDVFDLNDIVRYIAAEQYGPEFDSMQRKRVYVAMYQTHVDELVDAGIIRPVSNSETHTYQVDEAAEPVSRLLTSAEDVLEVSD